MFVSKKEGEYRERKVSGFQEEILGPVSMSEYGYIASCLCFPPSFMGAPEIYEETCQHERVWLHCGMVQSSAHLS